MSEIRVTQRLTDHFDALIAQIHHCYDPAAETADAESIHDLRVAIKRIRVFLEMFQFMAPRFPFRALFRPFRSLFKTAGPLRDVHVQQALALNWIQKSHISFDSYYNLLKAQELKTRRPYFRKIRSVSLEGIDDTRSQCLKLARTLPESFLLYKINQRFVNTLQDVIFQQKDPSFTESLYHQIRIRSKEARYILELVQLFNPPDRYASVNDELREIHHMLGLWHDFEIARTFLEKTAIEDPAAPIFLKYLLRRKKECLGQFMRLWPAFLRNHPELNQPVI